MTINALATVNEVLIPVSASVFALKGIEKLEQTIEQVRTNLGRLELHIAGVLCTIYEHTNIASDVVRLIRDRFGERAFQTVISKNVKLEEAHSRSQSIYAYEPKSSGARDYTSFVEEVLSRG